MSTYLPSPSPSPPPPVPTPTLPAHINTATRKQHAELNRLIVNRLPLALPPKTLDPQILSRGLTAFGSIFSVFEYVWYHLEKAVESDDDSLPGTHDAQIKRWLATLRPGELLRYPRLQEDFAYLSDRTGTVVGRPSFIEHWILDAIREDLEAKPHLLLAYGWVMYMAIFSGGRWIRQHLSSAGVEFWTGHDPCMEFEKHELQLLDLPGFSFLSFDGEEDGEDVKSLFKGRLAEAETLLTQQERQEIVEAAQVLFGRCISLVGMLDWEIWWQKTWKKMLLALLCIVAAIGLLYLHWKDNFAYP
jgi:heme oxygenase